MLFPPLQLPLFHATLPVYILDEPCTYGALCRVFIEHDKIGGRTRTRTGANFCAASDDGRSVGRSPGVNFTQITSIRYTASEKERRQVDRPSDRSAICSCDDDDDDVSSSIILRAVNIANSRGPRAEKEGKENSMG